MKLFGALLFFCGIAAAQQASIEGAAVNAVNGEPLARVHVTLVGVSFDEAVNGTYGALSDAKGHFSIQGLAPGAYFFMAERRGFVLKPAKTGPLPLPGILFKPGQRVDGYKLEMMPRAVIAGRVVDEFGDPVMGAHVDVEPTSGAPVFNLAGRSVQTDDRGEFRISGAPGKFYLRVNPPERGYGGVPEIRSDGTSQIRYGSTYFPNAATKENAAVVEAAAGADVTGLEVRLARRSEGPKTRSFSISGVVHGLPDGGGQGTLWLVHGARPDQMQNRSSQGLRPDGSFRIADYEPGYYRVCAMYADGKTSLLSEPVEFQLTSADLTDLNLTLSPGGDLTGKVEFEGDPPDAAKEKTTVRIGGASGETDRSGAFRLTGIVPARSRWRSTPCRRMPTSNRAPGRRRAARQHARPLARHTRFKGENCGEPPWRTHVRRGAGEGRRAREELAGGGGAGSRERRGLAGQHGAGRAGRHLPFQGSAPGKYRLDAKEKLVKDLHLQRAADR